jgi:hypothetical protein
MRDQYSILTGSQRENFEIGKAAKTSDSCRSEIKLRFPTKHPLHDVFVQVGVRLESDLHARGVCNCCFASSSFL